MIRCFLLLAAAILCVASPATAGFPQTLQLDSRSPEIVVSDSTRAGWQYTITVTGTYSMWPSYEARGVDAAYVYDVPESEIAALRWPPKIVYPIPHWVGDTLEIPPFDIPGLQFKFRTRENIGFRVNGQPLPDRGLNPVHRYQATVVGDGGPISFQILDSAFNIQQGRIVPRYEDNSGSLEVLVEERPLFNLCGISTDCVDGKTRLGIAASLLSYDDTTGRPENILRDPSQLLVTIDGVPIAVDSVSCAHRDPVAYALVLDRSGSMDFAYDGATTRMQALKRAALGFLRSLKPGDQAELMSFSFDDDITIDVPWTGDTAALGRGIRALGAEGGTAWRDAAWLGVGEAARHYNPIRAVVLLTDGDDTHSRRSLEEVATSAQQLNVPVFAIGVSLEDTSERPLRYLAARSNGRFFRALDQRQMDSVFSNLSRAIASDECCTLYVTVPRSLSDTAGLRRLELSTRDAGGSTLLRTESVYLDDSCSRVTAVDELSGPNEWDAALLVWPNPVRDWATVQMDLAVPGVLTLEAVAADGRVVPLLGPLDLLAGAKRFSVDVTGLAPGSYLLRAQVNGQTAAVRRLVILD